MIVIHTALIRVMGGSAASPSIEALDDVIEALHVGVAAIQARLDERWPDRFKVVLKT